MLGGDAGGATHIWAPGTAILTRLFCDRVIVKKDSVDLRECCRVERFQWSELSSAGRLMDGGVQSGTGTLIKDWRRRRAAKIENWAQ